MSAQQIESPVSQNARGGSDGHPSTRILTLLQGGLPAAKAEPAAEVTADITPEIPVSYYIGRAIVRLHDNAPDVATQVDALFAETDRLAAPLLAEMFGTNISDEATKLFVAGAPDKFQQSK